MKNRVEKRVEKRVEFSTFKGLINLPVTSNLSVQEREVLNMYKDEFLTVKQIAIRRDTSDKAVYKIINRIKKKGLFSDKNNRVENSRGTQKNIGSGSFLIRLHAQEFNIKILFKASKYACAGKVLFVDGNQVRCFEDSIEVYSGKSFFSEDVKKATADSLKYWHRFFSRLESDLGVVILKPRVQNIKLVQSHYAECGNEVAKDFNGKKEKLKVFSNDDGKLWFLVDNSFNLDEAEAVHSETAQLDMSKLKDFFNDVRDSPQVKISDISGVLLRVSKRIDELSSLVHALASSQKSQVDLVSTFFQGFNNPCYDSDNEGEGKSFYNPLV